MQQIYISFKLISMTKRKKNTFYFWQDLEFAYLFFEQLARFL